MSLVGLVFGVLCSTTAVDAATLLGDANCDRVVDVADIATVTASVFGHLGSCANTDSNGDGTVDAADITLVVNALANPITSTPTVTVTMSPTHSAILTTTVTATIPFTPRYTPTSSPGLTPPSTSTAIQTPTNTTVAHTASPTGSSTAIATASTTPATTSTPSISATPTLRATSTSTVTSTHTGTYSPTPTSNPTLTHTSTSRPTTTATATPPITTTPTPLGTFTPRPTATWTPLGMRHFVLHPATSRWTVRLSDGTSFDLGSFAGQTNGQAEPGFIDFSASMTDATTGATAVAITDASDFLFVDVTGQFILCLRPQVAPMTAAQIDCAGSADRSTKFSIDHNIGDVSTGTITAAQCATAGGHVEGAHRLCAQGIATHVCRHDSDCDTSFESGDGICGLERATCTDPPSNVGIGCQADGDCDSDEQATDGVCGLPGTHIGVCNGPLTQSTLGTGSNVGALLLSGIDGRGWAAAVKIEMALPCGDEGDGLTTFLPFTSSVASSSIVNADNRSSSLFSYETQGENFSCVDWRNPTSPGCLALTVPALDQGAGVDTITEFHLCSHE